MTVSDSEYFDFFKNLKLVPMWEEKASDEDLQIKIFQAILKKTKKMGPSFSHTNSDAIFSIQQLLRILKNNYKMNNKLKRIEWDKNHSSKTKQRYKECIIKSKELKSEYISSASKLIKIISASKIHDEIYSLWKKISMRGEKEHGDAQWYMLDPDYNDLSHNAGKLLTHRPDGTKFTNEEISKGSNFFGSEHTTGEKYLNYVECEYPSKCSKYLKALANDLKVVKKVYNKLFNSSVVTTKSKKVCPPGSTINPKTGRCNKTKTKSKKVCPPGSIINPKTGRCNKIKTKK